MDLICDDLRGACCIVEIEVQFEQAMLHIILCGGESSSRQVSSPWRLVRGDLQQDMLQLKEEGCPDEPVPSQLWELMHAGYPMLMLVSVLEALGQAGWTAVQQSSSMLRLRSSSGGTQTMVCRLC